VANPALQRARFLAPGDKLGKHDLIRQIAVGGMAELYLARTMGIEGFEKLVVVKRILPQYANNSSFVNMFLNEARLAATLHHPNIAQVYDIGQEQGEYFFSMEYVHGEDLGQIVRTSQENGVPVSLDVALTLVTGLCAGLHHAHEKTAPDGRPLNVVHRDVSPSNVLVSYDGSVKLVDFGIARANTTPSSTAGGLKGKIAYMSPEQCKGKTTLDRRSDIFSVGTLLYELTTGQLPFTDENEYAVLNHIVNDDVVPPSKLVPGYPPALEAIVMKALARETERRFKTTLEFQTQLEDFAHENRLRVSPLVLARLMSTLFPQRLEEWKNARAQGAFFVEQHVVRTLIESSRSDIETLPEPAQAVATPGGTDQAPVVGELGEDPEDDATAVTTPPVSLEELPTDIQVPIPTRPPTPTPTPPHRPPPTPSRTQVGMGQEPPHRPTPTPVPAQEPTYRPTPTPVRQSSPRIATPVPGMPGAVPIVQLAPSQPGTLISNPAPLSPVIAAVGDRTERVRIPDRKKRSRAPVIILALVGALAASAVTFLLLNRQDDLPAVTDTTTARPEPVVEPAGKAKPTEADPATVEIADPPGDEPGNMAGKEPTDDTAKAPPAPVEPAVEPVKPAPVEPAPAKVAPVKAEPPQPKVAEQVKRPKPKVRKPPRRPTKPTPKPKEDPKWNGDSPFMPVRTDKR